MPSCSPIPIIFNAISFGPSHSYPKHPLFNLWIFAPLLTYSQLKPMNSQNLSLSLIVSQDSDSHSNQRPGRSGRDYIERNDDSDEALNLENSSGTNTLSGLQAKEESSIQIKKAEHQPRNIKNSQQKTSFKKQQSQSSDDWDEQPNENTSSAQKDPKKQVLQNSWMENPDQQNSRKKKQSSRGNEKQSKNGQSFTGKKQKSQADSRDQLKKEEKTDPDSDLSICQKQIEPEKKEANVSWVVQEETQPKSRGNRGNRRSEPEQDTPVRGNRRENRDAAGDDFGRHDGFRKKNYYEESGRRNQNYNKSYGGYGDRGGRGGRGGRGRDNHGYMQRREYGERTQDRDRQYGNNHRNHNNRFDKKESYEHVNRKYQKNGNFYKGENDFDRDRERDRDYEQNSKDCLIQNERKARLKYESASDKVEKVVAKVPEQSQETPKPKSLSILPRGQKCWPQMSIFVNQTKLSFSYRQITEHECDILIIPYKDIKLEMYPGNIINKCKADYRKKILDKGSEIQEVGFIYPQKCVGIPNFKAFGFLKMSKSLTDIRACFSGILPKLRQLKMPVTSVLIPYSKQMGPAKDFLKTIIESLGQNDGFTEVNISTNNGSDFKAGLQAFCEEIGSFMDDNKICIDY